MDQANEKLARIQKFVPSSLKTAKERKTWANLAIVEISELMHQGYYYIAYLGRYI